MAKDFRANQIRTAQIIASGTDWAAKQPSFPTAGGSKTTREKPNLGLLMFSSSYAEDYGGGIKDVGALLNESGNEAWLIVSGSSTAKTQLNRPREDGGSVLFMGDVIISGTLFAKRQLIIIDNEVAGDFFVRNNTHLSGNLFVGPTSYSGSNIGGSVLSASSISPFTPDGAGSIGTDLIAAFRGDEDTPPMIAFNTIDPRTKRAIEGGSYPTAPTHYDHGVGSDTFFWVSGSKDSINNRFGGVACFGGDMVISGNIVVSGSNNIHDLSRDQILNNSSSVPPMFGHDYTFGSPINTQVRRYDRWKINDKQPFDADWGTVWEYETIVQTTPTKTAGASHATLNGIQEASRPQAQFTDIVLSASYGRLVLSGTGDVAISKLGAANGYNGGALRFASSGSNASWGPQIRFDVSTTPHGTMKYGNRPATGDAGLAGRNGPHQFIGGTVTGSAGFMVPAANNAILNEKGQAIGYMFQGTNTAGGIPGSSGLYQNQHEVSRSSPILGGPLNTLVLTGAHIQCDVKVGAAKNLHLDGFEGVHIRAGNWYNVGDDAPVSILATGVATLSGSDGVNIQADTGEIDITTTGDVDINSAAFDVDASGQINFDSDSYATITALRFTVSTDGVGGAGAVSLQSQDTTTGVTIANMNAGVPVLLGSTTSEVTIGDNLNVGGNGIFEGSLTVKGDFIKGHVISASMADPLLLLNSGALNSNTGGGIAIASGSNETDQALVFGRDTAFADTFIAGRLDVRDHVPGPPGGGGALINLAGAVPIAVHASAIRLDVGVVLSSSTADGLIVSNPVLKGPVTLKAGTTGISAGNVMFSGSMFSFQRGHKLYFDEPTATTAGQYLVVDNNSPHQMSMRLKSDGLRFTGTPKLQFQGAGLSIEGGIHTDKRSQTLYLSASTASGNPGNIVLSGSHNLMFTGSDYSFKMGQSERLYFDETAGEGGPYYIEVDTTNNRLHVVAESSGQIQLADALFVNSANTRIGVHVSNPEYAVDVAEDTVGTVLRLQQTAANAIGAQIRLENKRGYTATAGVAGDYCGGIQFWSTDDSPIATEYAKILAQVKDPANGSEAGRIRIQLRDSSLGTPTTVDAMDIMLDQVLILSGGHATDTDESDYTDLAFFVSGSINNANHNTVKGTSLFGGDVVVSGALHVKNALTASGLATAHLTLTDTAAVLGFYEASNYFIKKDSLNLTFRDAALGLEKTLTQLASLSVVDNSDVFSVTHGAPSYVVTTGSFSFDTNERATNATPAAGGPGADTYFFVSGSRGCRGSTDRGLALFAGDLHVSGTVTSDDSVFGGSLDDAYNTPQGGGTKVNGVGGSIGIVSHAPLTLTVEGQTTSTVLPLLQLSGGIKVGQLRIAPSADSDGFYTKAVIFNTASNGEIIFGAGSATAEAFKINSNANVGIERNSGTGVGRKLFFRPSENTTYLQYTNTEAGSPGPRVLNIANRTTNGRISFSMGASGNPATGAGYEGILAVSGSIEPGADDLYDLGSPAKRFANLYTGDLHLRNDRGNWTIYEEPDMLVVVNNLTGKKYKMGLTPLEDDE